jgi:hypothetical protein
MIEQDRGEIRLEGRRHEAPHVLVAPKTVGEHHRPFAAATDLHIVAVFD